MKNCSSSQKCQQVLNLLNLCLNQNYFEFNGNFYIQNEGLPMGSPLSPLLAEIFMNYLETELLKSQNSLVNNVKFWFRYVDDILCLFSGSDRQLNNFLNKINNLNPHIKFTMEMEVNKSINFLDIKIRSINNKFKFNIYRKETFTDVIIPANSNHPLNIKLSVFHSYLDRLLRIPMDPIDHNNELNTILNIAHSNGYNKDVIYKLYKKKQTKSISKFLYAVNNVTSNNEKIYKKLQFLNKVSYSLANELKKFNIIAGFSTQYTLKNILVNNKLSNKNPFCNSGVYKIECSNCNYVYIGQTGRNFNIRYKEHMSAYKNNKSNSNVAKHLITNKHICHYNNLSILHKERKGQRLTFLESFEIKKHLQNGITLMNEHLDLIDHPFLDCVISGFSSSLQPLKI